MVLVDDQFVVFVLFVGGLVQIIQGSDVIVIVVKIQFQGLYRCGFFVDSYYDFGQVKVLKVEWVCVVVFVDGCLFYEGNVYF